MRHLRFIAVWLALLSVPAFASQATLVTPGSPLPMASLASFLNSALLSIGSCNSGNSAPANGTGGVAFPGECWINTTANPWVFSYTVDGTHWSEVGTFNTSTFVWTPFSNNFSISLGGNISTAGALTQAGAFPLTLTATATTNSTFPAGTHTLAGLDVNQTFSGTDTFSGTFNLTGSFQVNGNLMTFPGVAATLASIGGSQTYTGNNTFNGTTALAGGGSLAGTFSGTPTLSGNLTFSGKPIFSGLITGTCVSGLAIDSGNNLVETACPGAASSIQVGATSVTSGTNPDLLYNNAGTLGNVALTAGTGIGLSGTANATISTNHSAGPGISITGTNPQTIGLSLGGATLQQNPSNPTGFSTSAVMSGLGVTTCRITTVFSSRVYFHIQGQSAAGTAGAFVTIKLIYADAGSVTAPTNGASQPGGATQLGGSVQNDSPVGTGPQSFAMSGVVTGLTAGHTYWLDLAGNTNSGSASYSNLSCTAFEF